MVISLIPVHFTFTGHTSVEQDIRLAFFIYKGMKGGWGEVDVSVWGPLYHGAQKVCSSVNVILLKSRR